MSLLESDIPMPWEWEMSGSSVGAPESDGCADDEESEDESEEDSEEESEEGSGELESESDGDVESEEEEESESDGQAPARQRRGPMLVSDSDSDDHPPPLHSGSSSEEEVARPQRPTSPQPRVRRLRKVRVSPTKAAPEADESEADALDSDQDLPKAATRKVYMYTFSHPTDESSGHKTPADFSRESFATLVLEAYVETSWLNTVEYYCVAQEAHAAGTEQQKRVHYHMVVKTLHSRRFKSIVTKLRGKGVYVHASAHHGYVTAFRYLCLPSGKKPKAELDAAILLSQSHPARKAALTLTDSHRATLAIVAKAEENTAEQPKVQKMSKRVSAIHTVIEVELSTDAQVREYGYAESSAGRHGFMDFVSGLKSIDAFIEEAQMYAAAAKRAQREQLTRMALLEGALAKPCECENRWLPSTVDNIRNNGLDVEFVRAAILRNLKAGPKKGGPECGKTTVFLVGPSNSGKSGLLPPLQKLYNCFSQPQAGASFPLAELPAYEVVAWFDYEYDKCRAGYSWKDMLLWFEGVPFRIARPKNTYKCDLQYTPTQPVFLVGGAGFANPNKRELQMMENRVTYIYFTRSIPESQQVEVEACVHCFAKFLLLPLPDPEPAQPHTQPGGHFCPHCGARAGDAGANFCSHCGSRL